MSRNYPNRENQNNPQNQQQAQTNNHYQQNDQPTNQRHRQNQINHQYSQNDQANNQHPRQNQTNNQQQAQTNNRYQQNDQTNNQPYRQNPINIQYSQNNQTNNQYLRQNQTNNQQQQNDQPVSQPPPHIQTNYQHQSNYQPTSQPLQQNQTNTTRGPINLILSSQSTSSISIPTNSTDISNSSSQASISSQASQGSKNIQVQKKSSATIFFTKKSGQVISKPEKAEQSSQKPLNLTLSNNKDIPSQPPSSQVRPSKSNTSIELRQNKQVNITQNKSVYSIDYLLNSEKLGPENRLPRSRGYVTLKNYLLEMKNEKPKSQTYYPKSQRFKAKQALLIDSNEGFIPTVMLKNVNMWDKHSDEAFKINVNQSFNRLTTDKINNVLNQLIPEVNTPEREKMVADIFVSKASAEKGFAATYAEFVKELSKTNDKLATDIIVDATHKLVDYALNPADEQDNYECESSLGVASFVAALISNQKIKDGEQFLTKIINAIPSENINPSLIEMLKTFVLSVGNSFIQNIDRSMWDKLETLLKNKSIPSRVHYLIVDTLEIINGTANEKETTQKISESSKSLVRNGFASFLEDYATIPSEVENMPSIVFFEGSMILFPDIKDIFDFTYYQCFVIKKKGFKKNDIINTLQKYIRSFAEQQLDMDCRHIWTNISTLLCQMILQNIINIGESKNLHRQIYFVPGRDYNPLDDWNVMSDLKFFIHDNYYFNEPIDIPSNLHDQEIIDALKMPQTILDPKVTQIVKVSRLIAVAAVRSVLSQFRLGTDQSINGLSRWKGILNSVFRKEANAVKQTLEEDFRENEYNFSENDVINYIK